MTNTPCRRRRSRMDDDQADELSEGATPPSFRPAGIHLCGGGDPA